jgi:hypothetical protein
VRHRATSLLACLAPALLVACLVDDQLQEEDCYRPLADPTGEAQACAPRDRVAALLVNPNDGTCAPKIVSVDEGPVVKPSPPDASVDAGLAHSECCYLVTRRGTGVPCS